MSVLWQRRLDHYPETRQRLWYLAIVVVATVVLYYELYVPGAVATEIIAEYHMSFTYYVYISVVGNAVGAFASLLAGLADRWGRANLVAYGLGVTGLLTLVGVPNARDQLTFAILFTVISFVEGIILVATPALVRDFSPQLGRASAMGFWTLGPVVGSLVLSEVSSNTIESLPDWRAQFVICGVVGLVVFVIALFGLRELSPNLRDQLMVSLHDRALVEARAAGIDVDKAVERPWRQMMRLPVIGSAFAISVFLIVYYTAVGFFTIYFTTIYGFSLADANGIGNWFWGVDALGLIVVGLVSDRLRVRKPFMLVGALGAIVMTIVFLSRATQPQTDYYTFVWIISALALFMAVAYAPWMASFTETVERINPALTATGLAVWGWIVRACVALSVFALPFVVTSMTPLVQYGGEVATIAAKAQTNPSALTTEEAAFLKEHGAEVKAAAEQTPGQWQNWWWVCVGGEAVFLPLIFVMVGRWRPSRARADLAEHDARVEQELEQLSSSSGGTTA
ncbi:MFS transporter [Kutzneria sp. NPDC052558]|uniref:MFS transporter n=1 Tax=Kutzneria sp. NPDC052558 TaxID=3364121 RepID=UPI0037CC1CE3